jgi:nicotinate-nucleotide pyrophosphorylase (carboxylating)
MNSLSRDEITQFVSGALTEDVGSGDATTLATVPEGTVATAVLMPREGMVLCGVELAETAFRLLSPTIHLERHYEDGRHVSAGSALLTVRGSTRAILTAERVALNLMQRLSGIATLTAQFVEAVQGNPARVLDTRKTTPHWRVLEKYAVRCGGGQNHRSGLFDMVLVKDNHLQALHNESPSAIHAAVARARACYPALKVEVEADTLKQVEQALDAGADIVLLDNMTLEQLESAVRLAAGRAKTEASGGVTLDTVRGIAATGVDFISVGALTHSARSVDIGLDFLSS